MTTYRTFTRNWFRKNPKWPGGREPGQGKKKYDRRGLSLEDARIRCKWWNENNKPGKLDKMMEFESE